MTFQADANSPLSGIPSLPLPLNLIMMPIVPNLSSPDAPDIVRSFPVLSMHNGMKGPWSVYNGLAPGSKHNNMAAVMEVNVSSQIDDLTKSMNLHEEERLAIWKKKPVSLLGKGSRRQRRLSGGSENSLKLFENARVHPS